MTDKKYYTPTIEEFHVGFEYQEMMANAHGKEVWHLKSISKLLDIESLSSMIYAKWIRVKHLDREDIESLGWINHNDRGMQENYGDRFGVISDRGKKSYILNIWYTKQEFNYGVRVHISFKNQPYVAEDIFHGYLKNKSELKKIMKQLGI